MDYDLLTDLIAAYKAYQEQQPMDKKSSLLEFGIWINTQQYGKHAATDSSHDTIIGRNELDVELAKLIIYLNRYAKLLIKKGLQDFPELISEDFTYLYILMSAESMTKTQLIEKNVQEKPTGLEVIKRLMKQGLIAERADLTDKRSKRVFVTEKGKALFFQSLETMSKVSALIAGKLTLEEKEQLFGLLKKLEDFHNPIYLHERSIPLNALLAKIG